MIEAELADGSVLEFPDGTSPEVIQRTVKRMTEAKRVGYAPIPGAVTPPLTEPPMSRAEAFSKVAGAPVDIVNRAITPAAEAVGLEPSPAPVGGSESLRQFLTGGETPLTEVGEQMVSNLPGSAAQFAQDVATPFMEPVQTAKAVGNLILGTFQKAIPGEQASEATADAVGRFFLDRYGSWEAVKKTMAEDPVGFTADLATILSGGGAAAARAPGVVGQTARAAQYAGTALDPLAMAGRGAGAVGRRVAGPAASYLGDIMTHTGGRSLDEAARAGYEGGRRGEAFRGAITGARPMEAVVADATQALQNIRQGRGRMYREGMRNLSRDKTVLDFGPIDDALSEAVEVKRYKGQPIGTATGTADEIAEAVNQWKMLDPAEFHTPEGLDALKQKIGAIRDKTQFGTPDRRVADMAYNAIKRQITDQAPEYARTMRDYWEASDLIKEMERTLSLNPRAQIDTSLRKLQSLLRNNANTNYGRRLVLGEMLQEAGADTLMAQLAGQALQPWMPRGLGRTVMGMTGGAALGTGAASMTPAAMALAALLPLQSPRLMGELSYLGGAGARQAGRLPAATPLAAYQAGRAERTEKERALIDALTRK